MKITGIFLVKESDTILKGGILKIKRKYGKYDRKNAILKLPPNNELMNYESKQPNHRQNKKL
ncbi:hypothetical protein [uncultured Wocania sp.]|uniref:hypothetical protein n=1 Tax=uncultured Wocania sp. TaxID=2834404 RepID=UPI0030F9F584